jgi:N-carbamoylputrescine amidase
MTGTLIRAALGQVAWAGDRDAMLGRLEESVRAAASQGVDVIAFPETCNTGYFCAVKDRALRKLAEPVPEGPTVAHMRHVARDTGVVVIVPLAEVTASGERYNSAAVIDADGRLAGCYRKHHLPHSEGSWERFFFRPGESGWPVFDTAAGRIGVLICWDRFFPEAWRALALAGADIIFNPVASTTPRSDPRWTLVQPASALVNHVFTGVVNWVHPGREGQPHSGGSYFAGPSGELLGELASGSAEHVLVRDLDLESLGEARRLWPFFRDRRPSTYRTLVTSSRDLDQIDRSGRRITPDDPRKPKPTAGDPGGGLELFRES